MKKDLFVTKTTSVKEALKKLDKTAEMVLLVVNSKNRLLGTISDGDIRRYILKGMSLENDIREVYNKKPIYIEKGNFSAKLVKKLLIKNKIELLPILNKDSIVIDYTTWSQVFKNSMSTQTKTRAVDVPIVIMAGGKGTRLEPFTKILPKPLIPIGEKPIIQVIMDEFRKQGVHRFYITLNYKGEMIKSYFDSERHDYEIRYYMEEKFGGTAGSLKLLEKDIDDLFFVTNCDVIVKFNLSKVIEFHKKQKSSLTILSSIQHHKIPYGVIVYKKGGEVKEISEKPEFTFTVNTGVYLLNKQVLSYIPENMCGDMTDLIDKLIKDKIKVLMYPVNENDYIDIGQWEEYKKSINKLQLI